MRLRVLVLVPFGPRFDSRHGGRVVAQLLSRLVDRHEVSVVYQRRQGAPSMDNELSRSCAQVHEVRVQVSEPLGPVVAHQQRVLRSLLGGRPAPVSAVYSRVFVETARRVALDISPDIIQVEDDVLGYCLPELDIPDAARVLVCHDPGLKASSDLVSVTRGRRQMAHRFDVAAWRRYWRRTLSHADSVVTFTGEDAAVVQAIVPSTPVQAIGLGIDIPVRPSDPLGVTPPQIVFVGGYVHPPNADAAMRLIDVIMPAVRTRWPGLELKVVGDSPTRRMLDAAGAQDEITGSVETVAPFLDQAAILVLPIRLGGGMRVKLLEGMAAGKAVIASPRAAAGLDVIDGVQLRIADSDAEFVQAILELLDDPPSRERLARQARAWAEQNLTWEQRVSRYENLYRGLIRSPAAVR